MYRHEREYLIGQYFCLVQKKERQSPKCFRDRSSQFKTFFRNDPSDQSFQCVLEHAAVINTSRKVDPELESIWTHFQVTLASEFLQQ